MHRNAPLTPEGRFRLCQRIEDGWTVAAAAESMNISRQTAHKWWRRYQDAGISGLVLSVSEVRKDHQGRDIRKIPGSYRVGARFRAPMLFRFSHLPVRSGPHSSKAIPTPAPAPSSNSSLL